MRIAGKSIAFGLMVMCALGVRAKAKADWTIFEHTSIDGTVSGSIRKGHVFKTRSGNLYEVTDHVYLYEYEYRPDMVVLRDGNVYQFIIEGFDEPLTCRKLTGSVFEQTSIDGTISGLIRKGHVFKTRSGNLYEVTDHV